MAALALVSKCTTLPFISIGDCSQKSEVNISTSILNSTIKSKISESQNKTTTRSTTINSQRVKLIAFPAGCTVDISQSLTVSVVDKTSLKIEDVSNMMNSIASELKNQIENQLKSKIDMGANPSAQNTMNNITTRITNILKSENVVKNVQDSITDAVNITDQGIDIYFAPIDAFNKPSNNCKINISQDIILNLQTEKALSTVLNLLASDSTLQSATEELKNFIDTETKGATSVLDSLGSTLSSVVSSIGSVIKSYGMFIAIVLVVGLLAFMFLGKSLFENPEAIKALSEASKRYYYF